MSRGQLVLVAAPDVVEAHLKKVERGVSERDGRVVEQI
jgi:hypothetical protein